MTQPKESEQYHLNRFADICTQLDLDVKKVVNYPPSILAASIRQWTMEELSEIDKDYEPIECFHYALQIYTRSKSPENWAQIQHNLGLAYFNRVIGDTRENLINAIECYQQSLEVYTQELFPRKWQIDREDLELAQHKLSKLG